MSEKNVKYSKIQDTHCQKCKKKLEKIANKILKKGAYKVKRANQMDNNFQNYVKIIVGKRGESQ